MIRNCCKCGKDFTTSDPGGRVCAKCRAPKYVRHGPPREDFDRPLTKRDLQICELVHQQLSEKQIAAKLHLTEGTVTMYKHRVVMKLRTHYHEQVDGQVGIALFYEREYMPTLQRGVRIA